MILAKVRKEMGTIPLSRKVYLIFMGLLSSIAVYRGEWLSLILILVLVCSTLKGITQDETSKGDKTIIVNGTEIKTKMGIATYVDIAQLAKLPFRNDYSLTWRIENSKGIMHHKSDPVILEDGMKFNIILTGRA